MSEKLQRLQLLANRGSRKPASSNEVSFTFRTEDEAGLLFAAGGATDYTRVYVAARRLVYETRRSGFPVINVTSEVEVTDGAWHELII